MKKVVLVTGGSSGLGLATAQLLASKPNYSVYATSRNPEKLNHPGITYLPLNLVETQSVKDCFQLLKEKEGRLDVLVNNAGMGMMGPIEASEPNDVRTVFETNFFGLLDCSRLAMNFMRPQRTGTIINVSSIGGLVSLPYRGIYSATKFALEGMSEALSAEARQFGINVCLVEPGDFNTNISKGRINASVEDYPEYKQSFGALLKLANSHVSKGKNPEDLAKLMVKIIETPNPKLRYQSAVFMERLSLTLKAILPDRLFERLIMNHYNIPKK